MTRGHLSVLSVVAASPCIAAPRADGCVCAARPEPEPLSAAPAARPGPSTPAARTASHSAQLAPGIELRALPVVAKQSLRHALRRGSRCARHALRSGSASAHRAARPSLRTPTPRTARYASVAMPIPNASAACAGRFGGLNYVRRATNRTYAIAATGGRSRAAPSAGNAPTADTTSRPLGSPLMVLMRIDAASCSGCDSRPGQRGRAWRARRSGQSRLAGRPVMSATRATPAFLTSPDLAQTAVVMPS